MTDDRLSSLLHIPYSYDRTTGLNCHDLAQLVRSTYQAPPLPDFAHAVIEYPTERSLPYDYALDQLRHHCSPVEGAASHLDLLCLRFGRWSAIGSVVVDSGVRYAVFMGRGSNARSVVCLLGECRAIESVWRYSSP